MALLVARNLTKHFDGLTANSNIDLEVPEGSLFAIIGPNGAGKTTLFNMLSGFLRPTAGRVTIFGDDVSQLSPDRIARKGVARSFQITSLFEQLTVLEHGQLALQSGTALGYHWWASDRALHRCQKRALELALALALEPKLLLLDEPTAGMALGDIRQTIELIKRIRGGRTVVLVEHNMRVV